MEHNGRTYGVQTLEDPKTFVNLTTRFVHLGKAAEGSSGHAPERFSVKITGETIGAGVSELERSVALVWYVAAGHEAQDLRVRAARPEKGRGAPADRPFEVTGARVPGSPAFTVRAEGLERCEHPSVRHPTTRGKMTKPLPLDRTYHASLRREPSDVWRAKAAVGDELKAQLRPVLQNAMRVVSARRARRGVAAADQRSEQMQVLHEAFAMPLVPRLDGRAEAGANFVAVQHFLRLPFELELVLTEEGFEPREYAPADGERAARRESAAFRDRFERVFGLAGKGYDEAQQRFARAALSNMLGGVGYFHGSGLVQGPGDEVPRLTEPASLLTAVPSRSFFPRGFLWDEGFHQLLVGRWDPDLSRRVLRSWAAQVDADGWLPREQILGEEARARVPHEFQVQRPSIANPPTQLLAVRAMMRRAAEPGAPPGEAAAVDAFLREVAPALRRQADWYFRTQAAAAGGDGGGGGDDGWYRWHERSLDHCLASGLDDYPRAAWLTARESHVDLVSWLAMVGDLTADIADRAEQDLLGLEGAHADADAFRARAAALRAAVEANHWSEEAGAYCDVAVHPNTTEAVHTRHLGYVSLFPFLLGLVPPGSPRLKATLDLLGDPARLWSEHGLLSLSRDDPLFGTGENYWRGAVWFNVNYLAAAALHSYGFGERAGGPHAGQARALYARLRENLVRNTFGEYQRTGYLWEQYNPADGRGQKSHPFTGWTALVVLVMAELY